MSYRRGKDGRTDVPMLVDVLLSCQYLVVALDDHLVRLVASSRSLPMLCYGQIEYYHLLRLFAMATGDQYVCDVGVSWLYSLLPRDALWCKTRSCDRMSSVRLSVWQRETSAMWASLGYKRSDGQSEAVWHRPVGPGWWHSGSLMENSVPWSSHPVRRFASRSSGT